MNLIQFSVSHLLAVIHIQITHKIFGVRVFQLLSLPTVQGNKFCIKYVEQETLNPCRFPLKPKGTRHKIILSSGKHNYSVWVKTIWKKVISLNCNYFRQNR